VATTLATIVISLEPSHWQALPIEKRVYF